MGRAKRVRKRRKSTPRAFNVGRGCSDLLRWVRDEGWEDAASSLRPALFATTGRGLMATREIPKGSPIVQVPPNLVINRDKALKDLGLSKETTDSTQRILSLFLVRHKKLGKLSHWAPYIDSLPETYDAPFFCPDYVIGILPDFLRLPVEKQRRQLSAYSDDYKWAWFTANTRAVYTEQGGMALVPFLDLFNHHPEAVTRVNEDRDGYRLTTETGTGKYDQVFINYGPHGNVKLLLEYGFTVPDNPHDSLPVRFKDLEESFGKIEPEKKRILTANKLSENMSVNGMDGFSWNVYACLHVLECSAKDWYSVYDLSEAVLASKHRESAIVLRRNLLFKLNNSIQGLKEFRSFASCRMTIDLLITYRGTLEKDNFFKV